MNHLLILPILLPLFTAGLLLAAYDWPIRRQRRVAILSCTALVLICASLVELGSRDVVQVYQLGNWAPPFGIVLALDRLGAIMLLTTSLLALITVIHATRGADTMASHFHVLFQFQLMGLGMAFLTGDLFNLFVAFEILLIASYALLLHGGGAPRSRAGLHYVALNLIGSALFILVLGLLYGITGTLNMADLALAVAQAPDEDRALLHAAGLLLLVVFGLKAAMLPLLFWLPRAYTAAMPPVAALFAIMSKVGIYAILRVHTLIFPDGALAVWDWLWPLALATLAFGAIGTLAARTLRGLSAYLVIVSSGTLLAALAMASPRAIAAVLYYLPHSTFVTAALFLLADVIGRLRGESGDAFHAPGAITASALPAVFFLIAAMSVVGLPPLSGFVGKILLLQATEGGLDRLGLWPVLLAGALLGLVALSRAGTALFWRDSGQPTTTALSPDRIALATVAALLALNVAQTLFAEPILAYAEAAAAQLASPGGYITAVLNGAGGPG